MRIEDYGVVGDLQTAALVSREGSIDWLCLPRFDSGACFAALLGTRDNGRWSIRPEGPITRAERRYRDGTLVLETELTTAEGRVRITDCMPPRDRRPDLVRLVEGVSGRVPLRMDLTLRFDYGSVVPWVRRSGHGITGIAGPDAVMVSAEVPLHGEDFATVARFALAAGDSAAFVLTWHASHEDAPPPVDARAAITDTTRWWRRWSERCTYRGEWREEVVRSLITLKAMTYAPTGGLVAAVTTSLPEQIGGVRNWDYRYCWLRDATLALYAMLLSGYRREAQEWRDWLLRAVAGDPRRLQILYGPAGERRLSEQELEWLPGYEGSRPVRVGNGAVHQRQLDVYGEVLDTLHQARRLGVPPESAAWDLECALVEILESDWRLPDEGMWEVRGPPRHFTHSKMMAWVAMDRAVKAVERFGRAGSVDRWRRTRAEIHEEVCRRGYDAERNTFTQSFGSRDLDAGLLLMPSVGFLPAHDRRVQGTVAAIQRELQVDGLVMRYRSDTAIDGLPPGEGAFLPCSFWLADCLALMGRRQEARSLFEQLLALRNDLGLLAEEYDPAAGRMLGNFPQAFAHVALVDTARNLSGAGGPVEHRQSLGLGTDPTHTGE